MKNLLIVESPAKTKTLTKFLGRSFRVMSSMGHLRDLPKTTLGIDIDQDFRPRYRLLDGRKKVIDSLRKTAAKADKIYLGTDPDREGEAIAWHIQEILDVEPERIHRVLFNEITKNAVRDAIDHPRVLDYNKVNAQQSRRILDRIVGYQVSEILWKVLIYGLSAGRVQSVALRLVVEREKDRLAFVQEEYWTIEGSAKGEADTPFPFQVSRFRGKKIALANEEQAGQAVQAIRGETLRVKEVAKKKKRRNPAPPFITSTLQQAASRRLGFSPKRTMMIAQQLYEGLEIGAEGNIGLITYMRTDSTRLSQEALQGVRAFIGDSLGEEYLPQKARLYSKSKASQDAHEAIRPTGVSRLPEALKPFLNRDQHRLYSLIWSRFVASQMASAVFDTVSVTIQAGEYLLRANGNTLVFDGFMKVLPVRESKGEEGSQKTLPVIRQGETLELLELRPNQHFTQPPPRYTEASLVKAMEENGIGRPSTYAPILSRIREKEYVALEEKKLVPTALGIQVCEILVNEFPELFGIHFTADMEKTLDNIEAGREDWVQPLQRFYDHFQPQLEKVMERRQEIRKATQKVTDIDCPKCGSKLVQKWGKKGQFLGCPTYPDCDYTRDIDAPDDDEDDTDIPTQNCPNCDREMVVKRGRHGKFFACSGYPDCKTTMSLTNGQPNGDEKAAELTDEKCPKCDSALAWKDGRFGRFLACSGYPNCRYIKPELTGVKCPSCGEGDVVVRQSRRGKKFFSCNRYPDCKFALWNRPHPVPCPQCQKPYLLERNTKKDGVFLSCECGYREPLEKAS